ncbi:cysteine--tRNA ligase [Maritimibacter sp. 55A14]|uniref:cysteine--tRNA ligase n=1 Tax=Maritimibacter sp. 55A14 TaxID=2174844 RepID=UPI000D621E37|nr:cysteine--tRNA ligase [Maritimibacter sp. 55A14]PWE33127.1 cysteine--tRNA ligase [Maritimibacter sp. 55A14]
MAEIRLWNTRTRAKEPLVPLDPENLRMYVCGPTVYDRAHIGNARPVVVFDVLYRLLRHEYGADHVTYVRNFTDVDDKINARAAEMKGRGDTRPLVEIIRELTDETIRWYHEDMDELGALPPTHEPRATDYIGQMVAMIAVLVEKGHAYAAEGHVLFDVKSYGDYGKLARRSLDDMRAGARVEVAPYKRDPMDFVLWKPSTDEEPGWDSPWGRGRPGWHIECSAMAHELLGESFDIHGGGIDLAFPHHENEVAQSACAHPEGDFAKIWMHNGFLQVEGEKMSKSLGNFFTVKDLLDQGIPGEVIRFVLLSTHYRQPLDWTERKVAEATRFLANLFADDHIVGMLDVFKSGKLHGKLPDPDGDIVDALADDLNTHLALQLFRKKVHRRNKARRDEALQLIADGRLLGFFSDGDRPSPLVAQPREAFQHAERIEGLLRERAEARKAKDFERSDRIRDGLLAAGLELRDTSHGTEWVAKPDFNPAKLEALK